MRALLLSLLLPLACSAATIFTSVHAQSQTPDTFLPCSQAGGSASACDASLDNITVAQASASAGFLSVSVDGAATGRTAMVYGEARVDDSLVVEGGAGSGVLTLTYWASEFAVAPWCGGCAHAQYLLQLGNASRSGQLPEGYFTVSTPFTFGEALRTSLDMTFYDSSLAPGETERTIAELRYVGYSVAGSSAAYLESLEVPEPDPTLLFAISTLGLFLLRYRST
jgi:hypothetical protein